MTNKELKGIINKLKTFSEFDYWITTDEASHSTTFNNEERAVMAKASVILSDIYKSINISKGA